MCAFGNIPLIIKHDRYSHSIGNLNEPHVGIHVTMGQVGATVLLLYIEAFN